MIDELDSLMQEVRVKSRREMKQAQKEAEASARAERRARFQALREAFDAERFRWLAQHPFFLDRIRPRWSIEDWRSQIDLAMRTEHRKETA